MILYPNTTSPTLTLSSTPPAPPTYRQMLGSQSANSRVYWAAVLGLNLLPRIRSGYCSGPTKITFLAGFPGTGPKLTRSGGAGACSARPKTVFTDSYPTGKAVIIETRGFPRASRRVCGPTRCNALVTPVAVYPSALERRNRRPKWQGRRPETALIWRGQLILLRQRRHFGPRSGASLAHDLEARETSPGVLRRLPGCRTRRPVGAKPAR